MRKRILATLLAGGSLLALPLAQAQTYTFDYPGGDGTPYTATGSVDTTDAFSSLPNPMINGTCSTSTSNNQYYDQVVINNLGASTASVVFTLNDPNSGTAGVCNFTSATNDRPRLYYYTGVFNSSAPLAGCLQIVEFAGSPSTTCPQLNFSLGAGQKATVVVATSRVLIPRPSAPSGTGGLFGWQGGLGGSSPVGLQSFTVEQGR